jgi:hypothetical protein
MTDTAPPPTPATALADARRAVANIRAALLCGQNRVIGEQINRVDAALTALERERGL